jgi:hypothetical protein
MSVRELEALDGFTVTDTAVGFALSVGLVASASAINPKF